MRKLRLGQALSPLLYGLFANSPVIDGEPSGFLTTRGEIWSRTDADRTGLLPFLDKPDAGFADYVDHALDVPMYFIRREGKFVDLTQHRFRFRDYLASGHNGHQATLADWDLHLSTLFTEVRLRPQVEVRCADSLPPHLVLTVAALLKGLMYDDASFQAAWELCCLDSCSEIAQASRQAWRLGLKTPWKDGTLQDLARRCLALAREGLDRQQAQAISAAQRELFPRWSRRPDRGWRHPRGTTSAEMAGHRQDKLKALIQHCGFFDMASNRPQEDCANAQSNLQVGLIYLPKQPGFLDATG